jgi:hypothetical protein
MRGCKGISLWVQSLSQHAGVRFRCRKRNGQYEAPGLSVIRTALVNVDPARLDRALTDWNAQYGNIDESLAIDDK